MVFGWRFLFIKVKQCQTHSLIRSWCVYLDSAVLLVPTDTLTGCSLLVASSGAVAGPSTVTGVNLVKKTPTQNWTNRSTFFPLRLLCATFFMFNTVKCFSYYIFIFSPFPFFALPCRCRRHDALFFVVGYL